MILTNLSLNDSAQNPIICYISLSEKLLIRVHILGIVLYKSKSRFNLPYFLFVASMLSRSACIRSASTHSASTLLLEPKRNLLHFKLEVGGGLEPVETNTTS